MSTYLKNRKTAILGLGREGLSTLKFLKKHGVKPKILDAKNDKNYLKRIKDYDIIFRTPGFPRLHPRLLKAEKRGTQVTSNTRLFFELFPGKIIGVTGTKGKTSTSFLISAILKRKFGKNVFQVGNFGKPALDLLPKLDKRSLVVFELSSFQLQDLNKSPHVAVITNMTLDHMDPSGRFGPATHQSAKEYFDAKMNIIRYQSAKDFAVINPSLKNRVEKIGKGKKIYPASRPTETKLKGRHNLDNIALTVAVGNIFKVPKTKVLEAIKDFEGVEHRLEFVTKVNGVSFYNDSAATNSDATLAALKAFDGPLRLILGGSDKGLDYKKLANYISKSRNIKTVALIGQIKNKLYKLIRDKKVKKFESLKDAVLTLYKKSAKNETVLLSPAAASFDMFESYAQRGKEFKKLVRQMKRRVR